MRKKCVVGLGNDDPVLDISSLIDVCFLLLIYFLVTSTIQPREQDLPMTLPDGIGMPGDEVLKVVIGVKADGTIVMNTGEDEEVLDTDVARSNGSELFVEISSDAGVRHQRFIDVLNCLKGEGIGKISITMKDREVQGIRECIFR